MLLLDPQVDFHRGGSCAIKDADISSESVSNFISFNKDGIEEIYVGLDSHHRYMPFLLLFDLFRSSSLDAYFLVYYCFFHVHLFMYLLSIYNRLLNDDMYME